VYGNAQWFDLIDDGDLAQTLSHDFAKRKSFLYDRNIQPGMADFSALFPHAFRPAFQPHIHLIPASLHRHSKIANWRYCTDHSPCRVFLSGEAPAPQRIPNNPPQYSPRPPAGSAQTPNLSLECAMDKRDPTLRRRFSRPSPAISPFQSSLA
jgi:hypothetical protein